MDISSGGYPDDMPDRELRAAISTISHLKNDITKLQSKLNKTRELVLNDTISNEEKKRVVLIDIHIEKVENSMLKQAVLACRGGKIGI